MARGAATTPRLAAKWRKLAEARCAAADERLTPARLAAYAELLASGRPVSAYELIALLEDRQQRKIAPPTVYRHLDFLMRVGLVHRLESTQSYLPCDHPEHTHESRYLICSSCGDVTDFALDDQAEAGLDAALHKIAAATGFTVEAHRLDLVGVCSDCD